MACLLFMEGVYMSLIAVREKFALLSGRHDFVTDFAGGTYTLADNSLADWFINSGQKLLDRKASFAKAYSWYKKDVSAGDYKLNFRYCVAVKEVWAKTADEDRYELTKKPYSWIRNRYGETYSDIQQGDPGCYAPIVVSLSPDQIALTSADYTDEFTYDEEEILFSDTADHFLYTGILFMPPSDEDRTISIKGRFWSPPLSSDTDKSYWTEVHDDILIAASLYQLEKFYRNREGMRDYMSTILDDINDLDKDVVEEEAAKADQMEG